MLIILNIKLKCKAILFGNNLDKNYPTLLLNKTQKDVEIWKSFDINSNGYLSLA